MQRRVAKPSYWGSFGAGRAFPLARLEFHGSTRPRGEAVKRHAALATVHDIEGVLDHVVTVLYGICIHYTE